MNCRNGLAWLELAKVTVHMHRTGWVSDEHCWIVQCSFLVQFSGVFDFDSEQVAYELEVNRWVLGLV